MKSSKTRSPLFSGTASTTTVPSLFKRTSITRTPVALEPAPAPLTAGSRTRIELALPSFPLPAFGELPSPPPILNVTYAPASVLPSRNTESTLRDIRVAASLTMLEKKARMRATSRYTPHEDRPPVSADKRFLLWTTPHSRLALEDTNRLISPRMQTLIYSKMAASVVPGTLDTYSAGLVCFTQFCDREQVPESFRMPASVQLLAAFVADTSGTRSHACIRNWMNGLAFWHKLNLAPWHGKEDWVPSVLRTSIKEGAKFCRPPRGPVTVEHLRALRKALVLTEPKHAAIWAAATAAFWGCRRLGEMLVPSKKDFDRMKHVTRGTRVAHSVVAGRRVISIDIPWTKTTNVAGGHCILTATNDDVCPVAAMKNHFLINHSAAASTPLFAYREKSHWVYLAKPDFLSFTTRVYRDACLEHVFGHSYRIGGSMRLLLDGVAPEMVMKIGGWSSSCFLIYWRRLETVIPAAISRAWKSKIKAFAKENGLDDDMETLVI